SADLPGDRVVRSLRPEGLSVGGDRPGGGPPAGVRLATPHVSPIIPSILPGPVDVCVAVPRLELDRPFTYLLPDDADAGVGSMVSVKFHGRTVKGWIVGATDQPPAARLLPVTRVRSPVRFFDEQQLQLLRWVSERYVTPLCV